MRFEWHGGHSAASESIAHKTDFRLLPVLLASFAALWLATHAASATDFYVSPSGSASGDGSVGKPWSLAAALAQPAAVRPGDTIWLRGGTYTGGVGSSYSFSCSLNGSPGAPITVAQYPGERATLDGRGAVSGALLVQYSSWVVFLDFEVTDSDSAPVSHPSGLWVRESDNIKFINLIIHDMPGQGVGFWTENSDSEIYGCLIYYNGRTPWEHGIYTDNRNGSKRIADNILFNNYGYGVHAYASGSTAYENNITLDGNVSFNNGLLAAGQPPESNLLIGVDSGGASPALNPVITNNFTYYPSQAPSGQQFGYVKGCTSPVVTDNYFVGATRWANCTANATITGNTFFGAQIADSGLTPSPFTFPANTFVATRPGQVKVEVRANEYETGSGYIVIYNWGLESAVMVDLSGVLSTGAGYEIRNAQDIFGAPVLSGLYSGGSLSIPIGNSMADPVAFPTPAASAPEFSVFVVRTTNPARTVPTVPTRRGKTSLRGSLP